MPRDRDADYDEDDDRPRRRGRKPWDRDDEDDDRPRRRNRRDADDDGLYGVIPVNTTPLSIAAGYVGLISVLVVPAPVALILGILALRELNRKPKMHGRGRAIFAVVMGAIFTLIPVVFLIAAAVSGGFK